MMREMPMSQPPIKQSELPVILNKIAYNPRYAETVSVVVLAEISERWVRSSKAPGKTRISRVPWCMSLSRKVWWSDIQDYTA